MLCSSLYIKRHEAVCVLCRITYVVSLLLVCSCADGATDADAEPDEREADGHAGRLVQRIRQILWDVLYGDDSWSHLGVSSLDDCLERKSQLQLSVIENPK